MVNGSLLTCLLQGGQIRSDKLAPVFRVTDNTPEFDTAETR
jgi:hypothetical protein